MFTMGYANTVYTTQMAISVNGEMGFFGGAASRLGEEGLWRVVLNNKNTRVGNHGQLHSGVGTLKELVAIEDSGAGTSALTRADKVNFRRGLYYDSPNLVDDTGVSANNIIIGGMCGYTSF